MAQVTLSKKPFDIAIGCSTYPLAAQRWPFLTITHRIGLVALHTMIAKYQGPSRDSLRVFFQRVAPGAVFGGHVIPSIACGRSQKQRRSNDQHQNQSELSHHLPPCCS